MVEYHLFSKELASFLKRSAKVVVYLFLTNFILSFLLLFFRALLSENYRFFQAGCKDKSVQLTSQLF
ncbi:MAG: hypothetical protein RIR12_2039 [Bacteroidota bacterium]|jgi:hypothetical protein